MRKILALLTLLALSLSVHADTINSTVSIKDGVNPALKSGVTQVGSAYGLNVHSIDTASSAVNQGTPASASNAWPMYLCNAGGVHCLAINSDGSINVDATITGSVTVSNQISNYALETGGNLASILAKLNSSVAVTGTFFQSTQPVSAASLPLPSNAAQETGGHLASLDTKLPSQGQALASASTPVVLPTSQITALTPPAAITNYALETGGHLAAIDTSTAAINGKLTTTANGLKVDGSSVTQPVSAAALPLPSNAAQESGGHLASIDTKLTSPLTANSTLQAGSAIVGKIGIDQTTPGTTNGVVVNSSALPTGAATSSNQTSGAQKTQVVDGSGNVQGPQQTISGTNYAPVVLAASGTSGSTAPARTIQVGGIGTDGNLYSNTNDTISGAQKVIVIPSSNIATYSGCYVGLSIPASPTDIFYMVGSATKTVTINRVQLSGTETTVGMRLFNFVTRSSVDSGGTCIATLQGPLDQNDAAPTAVSYGCSVSPTTIGTLSAYVGSTEFVLPATTGVNSAWPQITTWADPGRGQGVVLRGTSQVFAINTTQTSAGSSLNVCIEWTEQ